MLMLAADTATQAVAVALGQSGGTVASATVCVPRAHSKVLQPMLQTVLEAGGVTASELEALVVGVGPGSYTGVRLAVATMKAMAHALSVPLYPVPTLWALAQAGLPGEVPRSTLVMPLLYARRGRAFGAIYLKTGARWRCIIETSVQSVETWLEQAAIAQSDTASTQVLVIHDAPSDKTWMDALLTGSQGLAAQVSGLLELSGGIGPALVRLAAEHDVDALIGSQIHALAPNYALRVEAEVKLLEKGGVGDGHTGMES